MQNLKFCILAVVVSVYFFGNLRTSTAAVFAVLPVVALLPRSDQRAFCSWSSGRGRKSLSLSPLPIPDILWSVNIADCRLPDITIFPLRASPHSPPIVSVRYYFDIVTGHVAVWISVHFPATTTDIRIL